MLRGVLTFFKSSFYSFISNYYPAPFLYRLVVRIKCDAKFAQTLLGEKFGCDPELEAPLLIKVASELGLNVYAIFLYSKIRLTLSLIVS